MCYVYGLFYEDENGDNICFYIGKGTHDSRMKKHFHKSGKGYNKKKDKFIDKVDNPFALKLKEGLTHEQALDLETKLLEREDVYSELTNVAVGKRGTCGWKHAEKTKEKIANAMEGKRKGKDHPLWNKKVPENRKQKIRNKLLGSKSGNAKLNREQAEKIKKLAKKESLTQKKIAEKFDVSPTHVSDIKHGKRWPHL